MECACRVIRSWRGLDWDPPRASVGPMRAMCPPAPPPPVSSPPQSRPVCSQHWALPALPSPTPPHPVTQSKACRYVPMGASPHFSQWPRSACDNNVTILHRFCSVLAHFSLTATALYSPGSGSNPARVAIFVECVLRISCGRGPAWRGQSWDVCASAFVAEFGAIGRRL